ncbi:MAG: glycosyltransferase family 1 protein, partial [Chlamydiia bacterium]|nr:glycosyltransferase family 1 protein [Chlamydiia bacterium]
IPIRSDCLFILYTRSSEGDFTSLEGFPNVKIYSMPLMSLPDSLWVQTRLTLALYRDRPDYFWAPAQMMPILIPKKTKTILTVHDFVYLLFPDTMCVSRRLLMKWTGVVFYRSADSIFCNSQGTANKLKSFYGVDTASVITPPLKETIEPKNPIACREFINQYGLIFKGFILVLGGIEPKKNLIELMAFYEKLLLGSERSNVIPLVIVGGGGWKNKTIRLSIDRMKKLYPDHFLPLGFIADEEISYLYSAARQLLLFSIYEGYGMPLMEARVCATPVACFNMEEMREASENDGLFMEKEGFETDLRDIFYKGNPLPAPPKKHTYPTNQELAEKLSAFFD